MTDQVKTNLKLVDGNLQPVAGYKEGSLPANTTVVYNVDATTGKETLTYYNHSGTPVNWDYEIMFLSSSVISGRLSLRNSKST